MGMLVAGTGMTNCFCRLHDPGHCHPGLVASVCPLVETWPPWVVSPLLGCQLLTSDHDQQSTSLRARRPLAEEPSAGRGDAVFLWLDVAKGKHYATALDPNGQRSMISPPHDEHALRSLLEQLTTHGPPGDCRSARRGRRYRWP